MKGLYPESVISRFDFAVTEDNKIKMLEFNSDTPTFIVECFQMNGKVCENLAMMIQTQIKNDCYLLVLRKL